MSELSPPKNDELIERQQFYTLLAGSVNLNTKDIDGIGKKTREYEREFKIIRDSVKADDIRNKTIIAIFALLWTISSGFILLYTQKSMTATENTVAKIEALEKKVLVLENNNTTARDIPEKIEAARRMLSGQQAQLDILETKVANMNTEPKKDSRYGR